MSGKLHPTERAEPLNTDLLVDLSDLSDNLCSNDYDHDELHSLWLNLKLKTFLSNPGTRSTNKANKISKRQEQLFARLSTRTQSTSNPMSKPAAP
jgi:hypothetical protein